MSPVISIHTHFSDSHRFSHDCRGWVRAGEEGTGKCLEFLLLRAISSDGGAVVVKSLGVSDPPLWEPGLMSQWAERGPDDEWP